MINLSIIIPSHNEEKTVTKIIDRVFETDFGNIMYEVILVDDGSTDSTNELVSNLKNPVTKLRHERVRGKSAAVRTGLAVATGEFVITQDADLELDPSDIVKLYKHAHENNLTVLYGSRRLKELEEGRVHKTLFYTGAVVVTRFANMLYNCNLTDEPTCYKLFKRELLDEMSLSEERFAYCPEVTAKALRQGHTITELPISYNPRTVADGKKIRAKDGLHAMWVLLKYRVLPVRSWKK